MATQEKRIIEIDENKITLPADLIPKNITRFSIEAMTDGRLVLNPIAPGSQVFSGSPTLSQTIDKTRGLAEIVDIRIGRKRTKKAEPKKQRQEKDEDNFSSGDHFVSLHHFSSRMEAEMIGEILKQSELPFLIQSEDIGIFGPSAAPAPGGARLVVRRTDLQYARTLLAGLI